MALEYAIFEGPHDDTRRAACKNPGTAYKYALNVDKCYRPDTYEATYADSFWKAMYNRYVPHTENFL